MKKGFITSRPEQLTFSTDGSKTIVSFVFFYFILMKIAKSLMVISVEHEKRCITSEPDLPKYCQNLLSLTRGDLWLPMRKVPTANGMHCMFYKEASNKLIISTPII